MAADNPPQILAANIKLFHIALASLTAFGLTSGLCVFVIFYLNKLCMKVEYNYEGIASFNQSVEFLK